MKVKWLSFIIAFLTATLIIPSYPEKIYAETDNQEIIFSSDFENNNMGSWFPFGEGTLAIVDNTSHSGESCLKITERQKTYNGPYLDCSAILKSGETYSFDAWIYQESGSEKKFSWTLKYFDSNGIVCYQQIYTTDHNSGEWIEMSSEITIPEDSSEFAIYFESSNATVDFYIDDVTIKGKLSETVQNENIAESEKNQDYTYYFDFEENSYPWRSRGDENLIHTDEYSYSGTHSIYSSNRNRTWNGPCVNISDKIKRNVRYFFSAYVMYNGQEYEDSHIFRMEIKYTLDGKENYMLISDKEIEKNQWEKISGYYVIPENAENIYFYIQTNNLEEGEELQLNDLMSFYVDTVTIAEATVIQRQKNIKIALIAVSVIALITALIFIIKLIVKREKKKEEALELASKDVMTKLLNRNSYEKRLEELAENPEELKSLYFALCDVNFMKFINDNFGHKKGDEAVIRCAETLSATVGNNGEVYRTGGDEFVCITKISMENEIRKALETESKKESDYPFMIASGFYSYNSETDGDIPDVKSIISKTDEEMYRNKQKIKSENPVFARK